MYQRLKELSKDVYPKLVEIRRELHKYPELSNVEYHASEVIKKFLQENDIEFSNLGDSTGVVAIIRGEKEGKTLGIRADIDALPIEEETELEFKSAIKNVMHACGHDLHVATVLGAAYVLKHFREQIIGNVKFVFQPAEECGPGGYNTIYKWGALENPKVDAFVGVHVFHDVPVGQISLKSGVIASAAGGFEIRIKGKGGHGSAPYQTIDPVLIGCRVVEALQSIISREVDSLIPSVLSVTTFHAGRKSNIIPEEAIITGTIRSACSEQVENIFNRIKRTATGIASASDAEAHVEGGLGIFAVVNDKEITEKFASSATNILGNENVIWTDRYSLGSDDFAYYAKEVPSIYFKLGVRNESIGAVYPNHNPKFTADENSLEVGTNVISAFALDFLKN
ncbi:MULTISPECIES: M20 family metallopeptidase [unclassified Clostridium]|uniref:M20 metallopeptidase family protein n=1 Tax=unclassified Clostridium TaxID=2614128 RepID=UPI0002976A1E|nr:MULTISPECIES: M20 family metallopeptidase [unclassified Clostridium]EKQ56814.1 MAG: amidohydrolase [Clostridium sp. Maddingley MBC34-26]